MLIQYHETGECGRSCIASIWRERSEIEDLGRSRRKRRRTSSFRCTSGPGGASGGGTGGVLGVD